LSGYKYDGTGLVKGSEKKMMQLKECKNWVKMLGRIIIPKKESVRTDRYKIVDK